MAKADEDFDKAEELKEEMEKMTLGSFVGVEVISRCVIASFDVFLSYCIV